MRVGIGHDTHRLGPGGPLRLGGVDIEHDRHALGHSDADVLLHAVTDALLGAAALGDIGELFPDNDPANRNRDSAEMLKIAYDCVRHAGYRIVNLDCIVFAERPKLKAYKAAVQARLAELLDLLPKNVGVKAKTGEGVGEVGRQEIIQAECVCLLEPSPPAPLSPVANQAMTASALSAAPRTSIAPTPASAVAPNVAKTIRVYNTLSKNKESFETVQPGKVGIYLCGPTVYKESHIGHMVGPVIFDTIKRYLTYCGYQVTWVVNITDVDDKLIHQMHERGLPMDQIADEMVIDYLNNLRALGVDQIDHMPKATEHMAGIIGFVLSLIDQGFAYASGGDVFFDVAKNSSYGKLSNRSADDQQGEGGGAASKKRNPGDFALWKSAKPGEPSWPSPWGEGRPGWHIECSAMSKALLGETFDIHGGGLDLLFPHHENELAQSECCHHQPMVKYWLHNGLLRRAAAGKIGGKGEREAAADDGGKVSRSKGAGGLADDIARLGGERIRFFLLRTHYRSTVMFGDEAMEEAGTALEAFYRYFERFQKVSRQRFFNLPFSASRSTGDAAPGEAPLLQAVRQLRKNFLERMDDDFNTGGALAELFEMVRELNKFADQQNLDRFADPGIADLKTIFLDPDVKTLVQATQVLRELSAVLGLFGSLQPKRGGGDNLTPKLMQLIIELRADARARKDFPTSDRIRNTLGEIGVTLEDRKGVTEWRISGGN